jgi:phosphatidylglycerophosphate synthase
MFDARLRRLIDKPLGRAGTWLAAAGVSADLTSFAGLVFVLSAALSIALGHFLMGMSLFLLSRVADGLDGAVARASTNTDRGGFLDIAFDFLVYGAIPLAFAIDDPPANALAAAILLASFLANGCTFLAFAALAERRGLATMRHGPKAIYYLSGIAEGFETIAFVVAFCLWPTLFPRLAIIFAALCFASAIGRLFLGWRILA